MPTNNSKLDTRIIITCNYLYTCNLFIFFIIKRVEFLVGRTITLITYEIN